MNLSIYPILYSNLNQVASTVPNLSFHNALLKKKTFLYSVSPHALTSLCNSFNRFHPSLSSQKSFPLPMTPLTALLDLNLQSFATSSASPSADVSCPSRSIGPYLAYPSRTNRSVALTTAPHFFSSPIWNAPCADDATVARQDFSCASSALDGWLRKCSTRETSSHKGAECVIRGTTQLSRRERIWPGIVPLRTTRVGRLGAASGPKSSLFFTSMRRSSNS